MTILVPTLLTGLNLILGAAGLYLVSHGLWEKACWFLFACAFLDGLDGSVARWLKKESSFGKILDSAVDLISFGILPAALFYSFRQSADILILSALFLYVASCLFRLVRFNKPAKKNHPAKNSDFQGLPVTAAAGFLASFLVIFSNAAKEEMTGLSLLVTLSLLMVSHVPFHRAQYFVKRLRMSKPPFIFPIIIFSMILILGSKVVALAGFSGYIVNGIWKGASRKPSVIL